MQDEKEYEAIQNENFDWDKSEKNTSNKKTSKTKKTKFVNSSKTYLVKNKTGQKRNLNFPRGRQISFKPYSEKNLFLNEIESDYFTNRKKYFHIKNYEEAINE